MKLIRFLERHRDILYRNVICILLLGILLSFGKEIPGLPGAGWISCLMLLAGFAVVNAVCLWKPGKVVFPAGVLIFSILYGMFLGWERVFDVGSGFVGWLRNPQVETEYFFLFEVLLFIFLAAVCMLFSWGMEKWRALRVGLSVLALGAAVLVIIQKFPFSKAGAVCLLIFLMLNLLEWLEKGWKKERVENSPRIYLVWLWPVWIGMALALIYTPAKEEPYDWAFAKKIYEVVSREWTLFWQEVSGSKNDNFQVRMSGFSDQAEIGGNLSLDEREVFSVKGQKPFITNLYLSGARMDDFQGRTWERKRKVSLKEQRIDAMETHYAFSWLPGGEKDYLVGTSVDISFRYFKSNLFFLPQKLMSLQSENLNQFTLEAEQSPLFEKEKGYGDSYQAYFDQLPLGEEVFFRIIENETPEEPLRWKETAEKYRSFEVTYDALLQYRREMKEAYLSETKLSSGMQEWVRQATRDCKTGYERLKAIEGELQKLKYTLKPGSIPQKVQTPEEFLDYFVLESRQGYCTYFATAFVLLARAEGYPARYVQGFCVPTKGRREVTVTRKMAHAWPEVYFEGLGWLPFEPTAGYAAKRYTTYVPMDYSRYNQEALSSSAITSGGELEENGMSHSAGKRGIVFLLGGGCLLFLLLGLFFLKLWLVKRAYGKMSFKKQYEWQVARNLKVLKRLGLSKEPEETLEEFGMRITVLFRNWEIKPPEFLQEYEEVLYGGRKPDVLLVRKAIEERQVMSGHLGRWDKIKEWCDRRLRRP